MNSKKINQWLDTRPPRDRPREPLLPCPPITTEMRAILMAAMANPTPFVFTYRAARAKRGGKVTWAKGDQLPITASGLKSLWRRARHRRKGPTLPADLRFHDLRHDFATKLLRETGNIRLVQRLCIMRRSRPRRSTPTCSTRRWRPGWRRRHIGEFGEACETKPDTISR